MLLLWSGKCRGCTRDLSFTLPAEPITTSYGTRYITRDAHFYTCACGERLTIPAGQVDRASTPTTR